MPATYLHGAEVIEIQKGPIPIKTARSAVIGIVGIAPTLDGINAPLLITTPDDVATLGAEVPGFTIPQALADIFKQGATTCLVVNCFNPGTMVTPVVAELHTLADTGTGDMKTTLTDPHINVLGDPTFLDGVGGALTAPLVRDVDYTLDDFGKLVIFATNAAGLNIGDDIEVTYGKINTAVVTATAIVGAFNTGTDTRTGIQVFDLCMSTFGFNPKLLIAPGHEAPAVQAELLVKANKYRGIVIQDLDTTAYAVTDVITERGPLNTSALFNSSSARLLCVYPYLQRLIPYTGVDGDRPYAPFLAGLICQTDLNEGYWFSSSNHQLNGVTRPSRTISAAINDALCQANILNQNGVITVFNNFGTGIRSWGNRSASYPVSGKPDNFYCVRRTADVIEDSVEMAMMDWIDKPLTMATIDAIRESVNEFIRTQIARGALVDGACTFNPTKNPTTELAMGHVTFDISMMPPTPAERITFETFIDISLLKALSPAA